MNKSFFLIMLALMLALPFASAEQDKVRVFLEFNGAADTGAVTAHGGKVIYDYTLLDNVIVIEVAEAALPGILKNPNVIGYELDTEVHALGRCTPWPACRDEPPAPVPQSLPWGVDRVDAELSTATGDGVVVCVVDTGIDRDHPDLMENILGGRNFVVAKGAVDPLKWDDDNGHGTHVAGTIAAVDNTIGVVGVAPKASLLAAKVLDRRGSGFNSDVIAGIEYCVANGAKVVSMSLGSKSGTSYLNTAVDTAYASGVLLVAAAGNENGAPVNYPAAYDSVIAVSATDSSDAIALFSNIGAKVELAAPGVNVLSTTNGGGYGTKSGTSMSTPHVSGVAALVFQSNSSLTNAEVRSMLQSSAIDLGVSGRDVYFGYGLVNAGWI